MRKVLSEKATVTGRASLFLFKKIKIKKASLSLAARELYQGQATHLSGKRTKAIGDKAWRHEERLFPWGVLGEARPKLLVKPSNERSLWGTAEDKRPRRKNSHVSTSITPNPCLVHPLLWQGERGRGR